MWIKSYFRQAMLEKGASVSMKTLGPILCLLFYSLVFFNAFIYLEHLVPLSYYNLGIVYTSILVVIAIWILFCVLKSHFKAMWSHPGFVSKYYVSSFYSRLKKNKENLVLKKMRIQV